MKTEKVRCCLKLQLNKLKEEANTLYIFAKKHTLFSEELSDDKIFNLIDENENSTST